MAGAVLLVGYLTCDRMFAEMKWNRIAHQSLQGKTEQMLPEYRLLYDKLRKNELFLYNYAAELNVVKRYEESLQIAQECEKLWADYDLQMLMADNCLHLERYQEAEQCFKRAASMCPVKFMPLYELAKLYDSTGNKSLAYESARLILRKKIKITSLTVSAIKYEMQRLIEREGNPAPESRASDEPINKTQPGQGNLSEKQTPKELLPP